MAKPVAPSLAALLLLASLGTTAAEVVTLPAGSVLTLQGGATVQLPEPPPVVVPPVIPEPPPPVVDNPPPVVEPPPTPPLPARADNAVTLRNVSGKIVTDYPLQFGRPFVCGEIMHAPQALIDGAPAPTQADVKNRCPDGSVKYAVLATVLPSLPAGVPVTLTFADQPVGNNTPLTKDQMLAPPYDFSASMSLSFSGGTIATVNARDMLAAGDCKPWTSGPIAQTVECADDTAARKYDIGSGDGFRPFRPRVFATFWPQLGKVHVRFVGENGLTTELEDLRYALTLSTGLASPQTRYMMDLTGGANQKLHWAMTQWTRRFWIGGEPEKMVNIDHGLAYLAATRYLPNYDTSIKMPEAALATLWKDISGRPGDIYDGKWNGGYMQAGMATTGGRPDLGIAPRWVTAWYYTGDWRMREASLQLADLSNWPYHLNEADPSRRLNRLDPAGSGTGLGHTVSAADRKSLMVTDGLPYTSSSNTKLPDRLGIVGPLTMPKWTFDGAHQPRVYFGPYLLTGDPYYLREMFMWAGFSTVRYSYPRRGWDGAGGAIDDQLRGAGRVLGTRLDAALAAPDSAPEKPWLDSLINDALARWEGGFGIVGTQFDGTPVKVMGQKLGNFYSSPQNYNPGPNASRPPALHNWESNASAPDVKSDETQGNFKPGAVWGFTSPWMQHIADEGVARAVELGYPAGSLMTYSGKWVIDIILHSGEPRLLGTYHLPVEGAKRIPDPKDPTKTIATSSGWLDWNGVLAAFTDNFRTVVLPKYWVQNSRLGEGDRQVGVAPSLAAMVDLKAPEADEAWAWYLTNVYNLADHASDPRYAILPRQ